MQTLTEKYNLAADMIIQNGLCQFVFRDGSGKICLATALAKVGFGTINMGNVARINDDVALNIKDIASSIGLIMADPERYLNANEGPTGYVCAINNSNSQEDIVRLLRTAAERAAKPEMVH